ncbi:MAG: GTPase HflX [Elusimicrobiota bacterium]
MVGLKLGKQTQDDFDSLMDELERLIETAGGKVVHRFFQNKDKKDPATLLGKGKISEIGAQIKDLKIKTLIFDDDLSAGQQKNIEKITHAKVIDRTRLILDIFAQRARTKEGQLQVELAQLNYLVPRLTGAWRGFSQQGGGIGLRGPGERKIEVERRYVRDRIKRLKKEISEINDHRERAREGRERVPLPQVALVGYTNVGKSTLLNNLTGDLEAVYADDKLFATLDPTTRRVKLPSGRPILFTDTVGFIQKLPHDLVAAFRATLEEVSKASLMVHVTDALAVDKLHQEKTVMEVIKELKAEKIPLIKVYNKADGLTKQQMEAINQSGAIAISAKTGLGVQSLLERVEEILDESLIEVAFHLPFNKRGVLGDIYRMGHVLTETPHKTGTKLRLRIDKGNWERISKEINN